MANFPNASIVLPCYNPIAGWVDTILDNHKALQAARAAVQWHIILVNDGSQGGIKAADIQRLEKELPQFTYLDIPQNHGKGHALRAGVKEVKDDICIYTDVDFPYTLDSLLRVYDTLAAGHTDIAVGVKNQSYYAKVPPFRKFISKALRSLTRALLGISITDTQCGLKGFRPKGRAVFMQTTIDRYLFDLEFIFLAERQADTHLKAIEVELGEGVEFSSVNLRILLTEGRNFAKVFWKSLF